MPTIKGYVFDSVGAPATRILRLYRRDTGALLEESSSAYAQYQPADPYIANVVSFITTNADGNIVDLTGAPISTYGTPVISPGVRTNFSVLLGPGVYIYRTISGLSAGEDYTIEGLVSNNGSESQYAAIASLVTPANTRSTFMLNGSSGRPIWDGSWRFPNDTLSAASTTTLKHVALCKQGTTRTVFLDGVLVGTDTWTGSPLDTDAPDNLVVGASFNTGFESTGELRFEQIRVTRGVARYTAAFTPPDTLAYTEVPERLEGEYIFNTLYTGEVQVVCLDDDAAPLENDQILRTFPV